MRRKKNRVQKDIASIIEDRKLFEALKKSTVFVTGATGLIGSMLMKTLYAANKKYFLDINIVGQIRNCEKARQMFNHLYNEMEFVKDFNVPCDYIIHTTSPTTSKFFIEHPVETIKSSVESTIEILEIAKKYRATLVYPELFTTMP